MTDLVQCARCGTTRPFSLTGHCAKCGFQGFKRLQSIEEHAQWPVYQSRRFHWQECIKATKDAYKAMGLVQKELAQASLTMGIETSFDNEAAVGLEEITGDTANQLLSENDSLRRKLQETMAERDKIKYALQEFYETVQKI